MLKQFPITEQWQHITIVGEPSIMESWRGWVPVAPVRDDLGSSGVLYLCSYSIYKALKETWMMRGSNFKDMAFWIRKAFKGRFSPYEVSWIQP